MKKIVKLIKEKKWIHYLIIIVIGLLVSIPLCWMQLRDTHDGILHLIRVIGLDFSIKDTSFPYLIAPYICRNFGYSMTSFYPPIVTYIPYILGLITKSFNIGIKIFASLTIILSGIFMYNFMQEVTKKREISFLAAIIYMVFPYHLETIYTRFAIGEFTSFIFLPIVFQGLYNLLNGDGKRHYYIGIGAIGLLLSHSITTLYAAIFCVIYVICNFKKLKENDVIVKILINIIFILLITAFFTVPLLEFKSQAYYSIFEPSVMKTSGKYTSQQTIKWWQFLKDKGEENGVSFVVGIPTVIMLCITILAWKYIDKTHKKFYITNLILGFVCLVMCTNFFPWKYMPQILSNIQYPWRMLGFAMFFFTPVFAMNVVYLLNCIKKVKIRDLSYVLVVIVLMLSTVQKLSGYKSENSGFDERSENMLINNPVISHFSVNRDYLPYKAIVLQQTYLQTREDRVYILDGNATIENENKKALNMSFTIKNADKNTILELPYLYYPGYEVVLENNDSNIELKIAESDNGFVQIIIPDDIEEGSINITYKGTTVEKASYIVSAISLVAFIGYIIYYKKKVCGEKIQ